MLTNFIPLFAQFKVNKTLSLNIGNPIGIQWSNSIINSDNKIVTVGNTATPNEGANVLISVHEEDGTLAWEQTFNSANANNDYGLAVAVDANNNTYVCGTTDNSTTNNFDDLVLKYYPDGSLHWSQTYNNAITIFPNPSTHQQTIKTNTEKTEDLSIQLMDIQGRLIKQVFIGKSNEGSTLIETNVESLAAAMYIYAVKLGSKLSYVRFFKQ